MLGRQLRSPILILLIVTAATSLFLGDVTNSIVIGVILLVSIGLGFANEFRAERAAEALHSRVTHRAVVVRAGVLGEIDVADLVPGDIVRLVLGSVVPADIRLLSSKDLLCDESILTGESLPVDKDPAAVHGDASLGELTSCVFMGTIVQAGSGVGVVVATGGRAEFGRIALGLGERQPQTEFQRGLGRFSLLLLEVATVLTSLIFIANLLLQRPLLESLLFSLAIAVGITPQLLPAVVSTSLATGTRELARRRVLVKRLVCIEDLGDMDVLVTDKTGTLTEGNHQLFRGIAGRFGADRRRPDHPGSSGHGVGLCAARHIRGGSESSRCGPLGGRRRARPRSRRISAAGSDPVRPRAPDDQRARQDRRGSRPCWSPRAHRKTSCGSAGMFQRRRWPCWTGSSISVGASLRSRRDLQTPRCRWGPRTRQA